MNGISVKLINQLSVILDNAPGSLAKVAEAIATAGANIEGFCQTESENNTQKARFIVDEQSGVEQALNTLGKKYVEEKILAFSYLDRPGVIAMVARALGNAGINIETMYLSVAGKTKDTVLYVGVGSGDVAKALETGEDL